MAIKITILFLQTKTISKNFIAFTKEESLKKNIPPLPRIFFEDLLKKNDKDTKLFLATKSSKVVAGLILVYSNDARQYSP